MKARGKKEAPRLSVTSRPQRALAGEKEDQAEPPAVTLALSLEGRDRVKSLTIRVTRWQLKKTRCLMRSSSGGRSHDGGNVGSVNSAPVPEAKKSTCYDYRYSTC